MHYLYVSPALPNTRVHPLPILPTSAHQNHSLNCPSRFEHNDPTFSAKGKTVIFWILLARIPADGPNHTVTQCFQMRDRGSPQGLMLSLSLFFKKTLLGAGNVHIQ